MGAWNDAARRPGAESGGESTAATITIPVTPRRRSVGAGAALVLVIVAAVLPYLNSLGGEFVFDDFPLVLHNPNATPGMGLLDWFSRETAPGPVYRPLPMVTYAL
ncbi:MAG: hypothetical protein ACREQL_13395, partial [Candidatus Binatia bacterium]